MCFYPRRCRWIPLPGDTLNDSGSSFCRYSNTTPVCSVRSKHHDVIDDVTDTRHDVVTTSVREIYCEGRLLDTVQLKRIYPDSKTFVDMKMKVSPNETLREFDAFMERTNNTPTVSEVEQFVNDYFEQNSELEPTDIPDWVQNPQILTKIADPRYRAWAQDLNELWKNLSRKISDDVKVNSDKYSILYVPNSFVIPGGRFRELYYWDTYWITHGLLLCDMRETVKGIIENLLYLLKNYGIIPNGGRVYYLERSQPPLLTPMVYSYFEATNDIQFVQQNIYLLEEEFDFWMKNRTTTVDKGGKSYTLVRYYARSRGPRPESYREDFMNAQVFESTERKQEFYIDLKSAAESGWDFSSRWFIKNKTNAGNLTDIQTKNIIPVDLNSFVYQNADFLSILHSNLGNVQKAQYYRNKAENLKEAIKNVFWNDEKGTWFDFDIQNNKQREYFYPSNLAPLWVNAYDKNNTAEIAEKVMAYIHNTNIEQFLGGIPTSLNRTEEQWDLPNAWPPLQTIVIEGLEKTDYPRAKEMAYNFADLWVKANYRGYVETNEMFEKYDAESPGKYGGGGEYKVQSGFGWTNGCILKLLNKYGRTLTAPADNKRKKRTLYQLLSNSISYS